MLSVFPAPAGINRNGEGVSEVFISVPRASGDKPTEKELEALAARCSPRQRG